MRVLVVAGAAAVDRTISRVIAIGGCVLTLGFATRIGPLLAGFAPWWNAVSMLVPAGFVVCALGGGRLPMRVLRSIWVAEPVLLMLTLALWPAGFTGGDPGDVLPWVWLLDCAPVAFSVLFLRTAPAMALTLFCATIPPLAALVTYGNVPWVVVTNTPLHFANVGFIVVVTGIQARLRRLHAAESADAEQRERTMRITAESERRERLVTLVHDHVLSVLVGATAFEGRPPAELRRDARQALSVLDGALAGRTDGEIGVADAVARLTARLRALSPGLRVDAREGEGSLPARVVSAVADAAAQAVSNSVRHAGALARCRAVVRMSGDGARVAIVDDGVGFEPKAVAPDRIGIRHSIVARMRAEGGDAEVASAPGAGTIVELSWTR